MTFNEAIQKVVQRQSLSRPEAREAIGELMQGRTTPVQIAAFLTALRVKGESVEEITGAAEAMRAAAVPVRASAPLILDTCGTGGDGQGSMNLSTAAAFVVAGAGFTVAKHGNRSISSRCGSADVLETLAVPVEADPAHVERCLKEVGVAFLFAPRYHPAMKHAMPVRRELGIRTLFNLLGPLTNPACPNVQLIGVYEPQWVEPLARVLIELGATEGLVVHGDGYDEVALSGPTEVAEIVSGRLERTRWTPEDFGFARQPRQALEGGDAAHNAAILEGVLEGRSGPYRDAVCLNAAALIRAASRSAAGGGRSLTLPEAVTRARTSIDSGAARSKLAGLRALLAERKADE